jgi:transcriptional regulator with XRE-family HTH domain
MGKLKTSTEQFNESLGRTLRELRIKANVSQAELAELVHVHVNTVQNWERGAGMATILFLRVCEALGQNAGRVLLTVDATAKGQTCGIQLGERSYCGMRSGHKGECGTSD